MSHQAARCSLTLTTRRDVPCCSYRRWGVEEEGKKLWDLVVVDEDTGGTLISKGNAYLVDAKKRPSWSALNVELTESAHIQFDVLLADSNWFVVTGEKRVPYNEWVHVAVTISKEDVVIYQNGEVDKVLPLDKTLLQVGPVARALTEIETPHPYLPNSEQYWNVEVPGAESYSVTFSDASRTEKNYDFVTFYGDDNSTVYGEAKYTGGMNSSERNFPGIEGRPPLVITAPRFRVYFHRCGERRFP